MPLREIIPVMALSLSLRVLAFFALTAITTAVLALPYLTIQ
jgi:hypothetical protein